MRPTALRNHRALWVALCAALGCAPSDNVAKVVTCHSDADCDSGQICFPEGCGDPGTGIVVEVTGNNSAGFYEQDVPIPDGLLGPQLTLQLHGPLSLVGELLRERSAGVDPTNRLPFTDAVQVRATGGSDAIPGVSRSYELRLNQTDHGVFTMGLGAGTYSLSATPTSSSVPPMTVKGVRALSGAPASVQIAFPSVEGTVVLSGRLVKLANNPPMTLETPLNAQMDIQAFDPVSGDAVSQRVPVASAVGGKGDFILTLNASVRALAAVELIAFPHDPGALVPTKMFTLSTPLPAAVTLEMGDFGQAVSVPGQVVDSFNVPVAGASVMFEGVVTGGGKFRSKVVTTADDGQFKVDTLPNAAATSMVLTVVPPSSSSAAVTQKNLDLSSVPVKSTPTTCAARPVLTGLVRRPDDTPAAGVKVHASEQSSSGRPLPLNDVEVVTDATGYYQVALDVGTWRLDYVPGEDLPQLSRVVTVTDAEGSTALETLYLPKGRRVTGTVSNVSSTSEDPMPNASLRFFRVTQSGGVPVSFLLATGVANAKGQFTVVVPTR